MPSGRSHKAIVYALARRAELSLFLEDGAVPLDNNVCERAILTSKGYSRRHKAGVPFGS